MEERRSGAEPARNPPRLDGKLQLAYGTREGDLFIWRVGGSSALNNSWWHYRHDERNTGQYGLDTRRPATVDGLRAKRAGKAGAVLSFTAPGNDWMIGTAAAYDVRYSSQPITPENFASAQSLSGVPAPAPAGTAERFRVTVPSTASYVAVRAVDAAGNLGAMVAVPIG